MSKELKYLLPYREKGEKKTIEIVIDFLSRGISRDFENLNKRQSEMSEMWELLKDKEYVIEDCKKEKPEGWKILLKKLSDESKQLKIDILSFDKNSFIDEQYRLLKMILVDNGVDNLMLLDNDFWERNVDVQDLMNFITAVIYKDIDLKKKH